MSISDGKAVPVGAISMTLIRSIGDLQTRPKLNWLKRIFSTRPYEGPIQYNGGLVQSSIQLYPCLSGKVLHRNPTVIATSQLDRLRSMLTENVNVDYLAQQGAGFVTDCGVLSYKTITDNGVAALAAGFAGAFTISNFKFHAFGTGTTAEAEAHANLVTELTTQYASDTVRPTGSQANTASAGGPPQVATYVTVGTLSPDSGGTIAITEHGLFAIATGVGAGANTMFDRSVFSAVNLVASADSLQVTYTLSITANG